IWSALNGETLMHTKLITYDDGDTSLTGFLAWDEMRQDRRPGIMVVHGSAGLDNHAKSRSQRLAEMGFVVFACDMFGDGVAGDRQRVLARIKELTGDPTRLCQRARAGIEVLASHPQVDGRLAAVGYCFGGMTVLELARAGIELAAVVSVHGSLKTTRPAQTAAVKAKILVCHGALDPHVPASDVTGFMEEMNLAGVDYQFIVYGGAMHGFTHEDAAIFKAPGVAYHPLADARSSTAMQVFFDQVFALRPAYGANPGAT
ncbi:MAG: dienelactone hydrolase family protein, partial [Bryobacteraceae bacterium]